MNMQKITGFIQDFLHLKSLSKFLSLYWGPSGSPGSRMMQNKDLRATDSGGTITFKEGEHFHSMVNE